MSGVTVVRIEVEVPDGALASLLVGAAARPSEIGARAMLQVDVNALLSAARRVEVVSAGWRPTGRAATRPEEVVVEQESTDPVAPRPLQASAVAELVRRRRAGEAASALAREEWPVVGGGRRRVTIMEVGGYLSGAARSERARARRRPRPAEDEPEAEQASGAAAVPSASVSVHGASKLNGATMAAIGQIACAAASAIVATDSGAPRGDGSSKQVPASPKGEALAMAPEEIERAQARFRELVGNGGNDVRALRRLSMESWRCRDGVMRQRHWTSIASELGVRLVNGK